MAPELWISARYLLMKDDFMSSMCIKQSKSVTTNKELKSAVLKKNIGSTMIGHTVILIDHHLLFSIYAKSSNVERDMMSRL